MGFTLTLTPTRCMVGFTDKERKHGEAALSGVRCARSLLPDGRERSLLTRPAFGGRSPPTSRTP